MPLGIGGVTLTGGAIGIWRVETGVLNALQHPGPTPKIGRETEPWVHPHSPVMCSWDPQMVLSTPFTSATGHRMKGKPGQQH